MLEGTTARGDVDTCSDIRRTRSSARVGVMPALLRTVDTNRLDEAVYTRS